MQDEERNVGAGRAVEEAASRIEEEKRQEQDIGSPQADDDPFRPEDNDMMDVPPEPRELEEEPEEVPDEVPETPEVPEKDVPERADLGEEIDRERPLPL